MERTDRIGTRIHEPAELQAGQAARRVIHALRLRCPHCGAGSLFSSWLCMRPHCPNCRLLLDRGEADYFIGGYTINLIVAELIVACGLVAVAFGTWPDVPWDALTYGLALLMVPAPFVTYPFSKALWLAIDLQFQPPGPADFALPPVPAGDLGLQPAEPGASARTTTLRQ